jgi:hypothetical protein
MSQHLCKEYKCIASSLKEVTFQNLHFRASPKRAWSLEPYIDIITSYIHIVRRMGTGTLLGNPGLHPFLFTSCNANATCSKLLPAIQGLAIAVAEIMCRGGDLELQSHISHLICTVMISLVSIFTWVKCQHYFQRRY